ncbi:MAG: hypothetical protein PGMFKBFP_02026 [Anaerolineales bacterium]|nr:hypothetical protein [Anaerolineales bacterium]
MDGRGRWKHYLLKPIDKVGVRPVSEYPGRNESERRGSLVKVKNHWPSLSILGEGGIHSPKLAKREKERWRGISGDTDRKERYQLGKPSLSLIEISRTKVCPISLTAKWADRQEGGG